jgi:hypothetical protein
MEHLRLDSGRQHERDASSENAVFAAALLPKSRGFARRPFRVGRRIFAFTAGLVHLGAEGSGT